MWINYRDFSRDGWCWVLYKIRANLPPEVKMAYFEGYRFRKHKWSRDNYMKEKILGVQACVEPEIKK